MQYLVKNSEQLEKREFVKQYVLNRANTSHSLSGESAAVEATRAWRIIEKDCKVEVQELPDPRIEYY